MRSQCRRIWYDCGEADFTVREIRSFSRCKPFIKLHSYSPVSRYSLTWFLPGNSFIEDVLSAFHSMLIKYKKKNHFGILDNSELPILISFINNFNIFPAAISSCL